VTALRIEKLQRTHEVNEFDCGREALNRFLARYAFQNQQAGASQTYIAVAGHAIIGYYTLIFGQVEYAAAPERLTKGLARHPVPIMLLGRLAVAPHGKAKVSAPDCLRTRSSARCRPPTSPAFVHSRFMPKTTKQERFTNTSDLAHRPAIPTISFVCLRTFAGNLERARGTVFCLNLYSESL